MTPSSHLRETEALISIFCTILEHEPCLVCKEDTRKMTTDSRARRDDCASLTTRRELVRSNANEIIAYSTINSYPRNHVLYFHSFLLDIPFSPKVSEGICYVTGSRSHLQAICGKWLHCLVTWSTAFPASHRTMRNDCERHHYNWSLNGWDN